MQFLQTTFIWFGIGEALRAPKYYQCKDFVQFQESEDFDDSGRVSSRFSLWFGNQAPPKASQDLSV